MVADYRISEGYEKRIYTCDNRLLPMALCVVSHGALGIRGE